MPRSIGFYSTLFGAQPNVVKADYAKWMLDDPRVNLRDLRARQPRPASTIWASRWRADEELRELAGRLKAAGETTRDQEATTCCYAQSNKAWVNDPTRHALGDVLHLRRRDRLWRGRARDAQPPGSMLRSAPQSGLLLKPAAERAAPWPTPYQRPLPLHRQFGALDPGRGDPEPDRRRASSWPIPPAPAQRAGAIPHALALLKRLALPTEDLRSKSWDEFAGPGRAGARFRLHRLRQRRQRSLPDLAGPADDRALGRARSGRGRGR